MGRSRAQNALPAVPGLAPRGYARDPMGGRQHGPGLTRPLPARRARFAGLGAVLAGLVLATMPATALGKPPGHTQRLGGVEPQGAATPAVTGLHYNPALLAAMRGTAVHGSVGFGLMQHRIRRNMIEGATGAPTEELVAPTNLLHPTFGYFAGASFYFDPWAIGAGIYDVGSSYRLASADPVRFHLAPDPDVGCLQLGKNACPPNGGAVSYQHDVTLAAAWNGGPFQIGAAAHFPMVRERFTFDNDTELTPNDEVLTVRCEGKEDPACAERVGFKGWTHWIGRDGIPAGFDAAVSVGVSFSLLDGRLTLGARYRTAPLRRGGEVILGGVSLVCRPDPDDNDATPDLVPDCARAEPTTATMRQRLPQQLAVGASALLGRARLWRLDLNAQWVDFCAGGIAPGRCPRRGWPAPSPRRPRSPELRAARVLPLPRARGRLLPRRVRAPPPPQQLFARVRLARRVPVHPPRCGYRRRPDRSSARCELRVSLPDPPHRGPARPRLRAGTSPCPGS